jgi:DegV family protein with EDD domain
MEPLLQAGKDVLVLAFSSGLSTTYNSAVIAAEDLKERYPDRKVYVVDTLCASMGQGLLVYLTAQQKADGKTIEEARDFAEESKRRLCHWFTVDDLNHLKRGGRISAATALVGTMLSIKPVLHVDDEGHLISMGKARGRQASLKALVDKMEETAIDPGSQTVFISHGDCLRDAETVAAMVKERFGVQNVVISYVGPVIGSHSGPGTMALFFLGRQR